MASNFTKIAHVVTPDVPKYNTLITESEGHKKQYQSLAPYPVQRFKLQFKAISNDDYIDIAAHYAECLGGYATFAWTSVPSYIDSDLSGTADGATMTGRWVEGSLNMSPIGNSRCNVEIIFEKDAT